MSWKIILTGLFIIGGTVYQKKWLEYSVPRKKEGKKTTVRGFWAWLMHAADDEWKD